MSPEEGVVWSDELSLVCPAVRIADRHRFTKFLVSQTGKVLVHMDYGRNKQNLFELRLGFQMAY